MLATVTTPKPTLSFTAIKAIFYPSLGDSCRIQASTVTPDFSNIISHWENNHIYRLLHSQNSIFEGCIYNKNIGSIIQRCWLQLVKKVKFILCPRKRVLQDLPATASSTAKVSLLSLTRFMFNTAKRNYTK